MYAKAKNTTKKQRQTRKNRSLTKLWQINMKKTKRNPRNFWEESSLTHKHYKTEW